MRYYKAIAEENLTYKKAIKLAIIMFFDKNCIN